MKLFALMMLVLLGFAFHVEAALTYFETYEENQKAFVQKAGEHFFQSWVMEGKPGLQTDLALYRNHSARLIVISSGLHGVEGYVGSSLQRAAMDQIKNRDDLKTDVLFVHALNPWGMQQKRRVNQNNVDLNRNFQTAPNLHQKKNDDYLKINSFLNPGSELKIGFFHRLGFFYDALRLIAENSIETLRKSILLGQYSESKGLYFGGTSPDELQSRIDLLLRKDLKDYKQIVWIDLHTGHGERAKLHLLANDSKSEDKEKLQKLFSSRPIDFGDQKNFYKTDGDMVSYLNLQSTPQREILAICFEFGTMNSQKTMGSIESLRRMVIENQGFQNGYQNQESKTEAETLFTDMFFPHDENWQTSALDQMTNALKPLLETPL